MGTDGRARGVAFVHEGREYAQRAKVVILSAFVVENPRLLLNSANAQFPNGLANSSGWVGKGVLVHSSHDVYGKFQEEVRLYKGTPVLATTQELYETDARRGFARGYTLHAHGSRPLSMAKGITKSQPLPLDREFELPKPGGGGSKTWGSRLRETMLDYNHYARVTMVGEVLPDERNRVVLADEKDEHGLPRAKVVFSYGDNDLKLIQHAVTTMSSIVRAAGGTPEFVVPDSAHLMGGCRMGDDPASSVTDSYGRTHDIPNLYICDASLFVTSGGGNPTNTVMALAYRTAAHLIEQAKKLELQTLQSRA
jgi:choline dehydrogenase-like flavoprotein